jgi:hypothetical protein
MVNIDGVLQSKRTLLANSVKKSFLYFSSLPLSAFKVKRVSILGKVIEFLNNI